LNVSLATTVAPFTSLGSISGAKRMIIQGSVDVNERTITDPTYKVDVHDKIKIGQKIFGTVIEPKK
jgi:ribosomal protein S4